MDRRHTTRTRKQPDPMLLGLPSPSLARIGRMNIEQLETHIERLKVEAERLTKRIGNLKKVKEDPDSQVGELTSALKRVGLLRRAAEKRLETKHERREAWERKNTGS